MERKCYYWNDVDLPAIDDDLSCSYPLSQMFYQPRSLSGEIISCCPDLQEDIGPGLTEHRNICQSYNYQLKHDLCITIIIISPLNVLCRQSVVKLKHYGIDTGLV